MRTYLYLLPCACLYSLITFTYLLRTPIYLLVLTSLHFLVLTYFYLLAAGMFGGATAGDSAGDSGKHRSRGGGSKSRTGSGTDGGRGTSSESRSGSRRSSNNSNGDSSGGDRKNEIKKQPGFFEQVLFGAPVQEYQSIAEAEMSKVSLCVIPLMCESVSASVIPCVSQ